MSNETHAANYLAQLELSVAIGEAIREYTKETGLIVNTIYWPKIETADGVKYGPVKITTEGVARP
jgi:hypothetical protein